MTTHDITVRLSPEAERSAKAYILHHVDDADEPIALLTLRDIDTGTLAALRDAIDGVLA